jgi:hypothetical protein
MPARVCGMHAESSSAQLDVAMHTYESEIIIHLFLYEMGVVDRSKHTHFGYSLNIYNILYDYRIFQMSMKSE